MALFSISSPDDVDLTRPVPPITHTLFGRILPLPFILAGIGLMWQGWHEVQLARASATWPSAPGQIQSVDEDLAKVSYAYRAIGVNRGSTTVYYGDHVDGFRKASDQATSHYKPGQFVTVYYNPSNAGDAVLWPGVNPLCYFFPFIGGVLTISGVAIFIFLPSHLMRMANRLAAQNSPVSWHSRSSRT